MAQPEKDEGTERVTYVFSYSDEEMSMFEVLPTEEGDKFVARLAQRPLEGTRYAKVIRRAAESVDDPPDDIEQWSVISVVAPGDMAGTQVILSFRKEIEALAYLERDVDQGQIAACMYIVPAGEYTALLADDGQSVTVDIGEAMFYELIFSY